MFCLRIGGISRAESDPRAANRIVKLSGIMFLVAVTVRRNHTGSGYPRYSEKSLFLCHSVSHKSHVYWPGIEPSPSWRNRLILTPIEGKRTGSASSTGRCVQPPDGARDTDMEDRPSCPDGGTRHSALAPQSVSVLKPPTICVRVKTSV
jgi:hypothetical protein